MYAVRRWVSRHPRFFELFYQGFERMLLSLHPLFRRIGYERMDPPVAAVEKLVKGFLFDTQMCGSCTLGATGMVCPMNCPKSMRNGPAAACARTAIARSGRTCPACGSTRIRVVCA